MWYIHPYFSIEPSLALSNHLITLLPMKWPWMIWAKSMFTKSQQIVSDQSLVQYLSVSKLTKFNILVLVLCVGATIGHRCACRWLSTNWCWAISRYSTWIDYKTCIIYISGQWWIWMHFQCLDIITNGWQNSQHHNDSQNLWRSYRFRLITSCHNWF